MRSTILEYSRAKTALVATDISAAAHLVGVLQKAPSVRLEAAFWCREEGRWEFVIATPVVHERGRLAAMREIRKAVDARVAEFKPILDHVAVLTPSEGIVTVLDVGTSRRMPFHRLISREVVNGAYVDGAYFYVFKPGKYIAA